MKTLFWLVLCGAVAVIVYIIRHLLQKNAERQRAEEARAAAFLAQMAGAKPAPAAAPAAPAPAQAPASAPAATNALELQKLLFDAARKAGDAGEPALAIQLHARLLARFPDTALATEARVAVDALKKKLGKA